MKKIVTCLSVMSMCLTLFLPINAFAEEKQIDKFSASSILIDQESGRVLCEKNPDKKLPLASLTKMMTFLLAIEAINEGKVKESDPIKIDKEVASVKGSSYKLKVGEEIPLIELMKGLMIVSGNDAAVAISKHISKTQKDFVSEMNKRAKELGMKNTKYYNVNGLPIYNYKEKNRPALENISTARDISILGKYMFDHYEKQVTNITDMKTYNYSKRNFHKNNTNALLSMIPKVDGIKTGYTGNAGYCLSFSMVVDKDKKNDKKRRLIGVSLGANHKNKRITAAKNMLNYGAKDVSVKKVIDKNEIVGKRYISGISDLEVIMRVKSKHYVLLKNGEKIKSNIIINNLEYPIKKNEKIGIVQYYTNTGQKLGKVDVVSANEVNKISLINYLRLKLFK